MDKQTLNTLMIIVLMLVTGFVVYYLYYRPETFVGTNMKKHSIEGFDDVTLANANSIMSKTFGVGFNIFKTTTGTNYMVEHQPITSTGTRGGVYALTSDGLLTIKLRNEQDNYQLWNINEMTDSGDSSKYFVVQPNNNANMALMYANGNLYLRPLDASNMSQRWTLSTETVTRGVPVLNSMPASMFSTEFTPFSAASLGTGSNNQQVNDVLNAVKLGIQQYLSQMSQSQPSGNITSSSLGTRDSPLSVTLDLGQSGVAPFKNIDRFGTGYESDVITLLNRYENTSDKTLFSKTDLERELARIGGCTNVNLADYTSNRIGQCNCKLAA